MLSLLNFRDVPAIGRIDVGAPADTAFVMAAPSMLRAWAWQAGAESTD